MNKYEIYISDIYEKEKNKKMALEAINVYEAHKKGLKYTNSIREEILKILSNNGVVYTFKNGFNEE